jgi:hypothetical protein
MANFVWTVNEVTGNPETNFTGTFKGLASELRQNSNGKGYYLATVEFENAQGKNQTATCRINEANYKYGMEEGKDYLCTAEKTDTGIYIGMSHLQSIVRVTESEFGFTGEVVEKVPAAVGQNQD